LNYVSHGEENDERQIERLGVIEGAFNGNRTYQWIGDRNEI
jgi:hypothetical protein